METYSKLTQKNFKYLNSLTAFAISLKSFTIEFLYSINIFIYLRFKLNDTSVGNEARVYPRSSILLIFVCLDNFFSHNKLPNI